MSGRVGSPLQILRQALAVTTNAAAEGVAGDGLIHAGTAHTRAAARGSGAAWAAATATTARCFGGASRASLGRAGQAKPSPLGLGVVGLSRAGPSLPAASTFFAASAAASGFQPFSRSWAVRPFSNGLPPSSSLRAPQAVEAPGEFARSVGGEDAVSQSDGAAGQQQQQQQEGWDEESELAVVPLDPNAETPGVLFVTAGATISALLAVLVAGLGALGAFYAGFAINEMTRELRATSGGSATTPTTAAASAAAASATGSSGSGAGVKPPAEPATTSSRMSAAARPASQLPATAAAAAPATATPPGAPQAGPSTLPTLPSREDLSPQAQPRRSWWAWLGMARWKRQQRPSEPEQQAPAGSG